MSPFIKGFRDISESLLTSCVPDVQRNRLTIVLNPFYFKINPNCTQVVSLEGVITVSD